MMNILQVKKNMNKKVRYENESLGINSEYVLSAIICEMTKADDWIYTVQLSDEERNCRYITTLEKISAI